MVEEVFRIVTKVAEEHKLKRIRVVNVVVGKLLQVQPELFAFAFDAAREGSLLKDAVLKLSAQEAVIRCLYCKQESAWNTSNFSCPFCKATDVELVGGRDILIQSIEGE